MSDCYTLFPCIQRVTPDTAEACARSSRGAKWLLHHRDSHSALDFPHVTFTVSIRITAEAKSLAHGLRTKSAPYGFTARSTLVAYRYLGQTFGDTQDVSRWLWLLLPLHRYGASRHRQEQRCFVLILKDSSGDLCRLVTPYKFLLLLCKVVYRTEIVKASRAASR